MLGLKLIHISKNGPYKVTKLYPYSSAFVQPVFFSPFYEINKMTILVVKLCL